MKKSALLFCLLFIFASCVPHHLQENTPVPQLIEQMFGRTRTYVEEVLLGEELFTIADERDADTAVYVTYSRPIMLQNHPVTLTLCMRYVGNLSLGGEANIQGGEDCSLDVLRPTYITWSEIMWKRFFNANINWSGVVEYNFSLALAKFDLGPEEASAAREKLKSILQNTDSIITVGEQVYRDPSRQDMYSISLSSFDAASNDTLTSFHLTYKR